MLPSYVLIKGQIIYIRPFVIAGITILCLWGLCLTVSALDGRLIPLQNAKVTELGVCLDRKSYQPVRVAPAGAQRVYVCGVVTGSTRWTTSFTIYKGDQVAAQISATIGPGEFYEEPLWWNEPLTPGEYRIEEHRENMLLTVATFEVR